MSSKGRHFSKIFKQGWIAYENICWSLHEQYATRSKDQGGWIFEAGKHETSSQHKFVVFQTLYAPSILEMEVYVCVCVVPTSLTWIDEIWDYLLLEMLHEGKEQARKIKQYAPHYTVKTDKLYRREFS